MLTRSCGEDSSRPPIPPTLKLRTETAMALPRSRLGGQVRSGRNGRCMNFTIEDDAQGIDSSRGQAVCVEDEVGRLVEALLKYALP